MQIEMKRLSELKPYEKNAKKHDKKQIDNVANSIKRFGWQQPIVIDENGVIVIGHCRALAAKKLGIKEVPVTVASGLTEDEIKELRIADNKTNESPWDLGLLAEDIEGLDFEGFEFAFDDVETVGGGETAENIVEDNFDGELPAQPKAKLGDVYQLGNHRLMCGDSTSTTDVEKLMGGEKADMVFTDPPYNIDYKGVKDGRKIKNDKMDDEDFVDFLRQSIMICDTAYVCCSWQYAHLFRRAMEDNGMNPKAMIVWNKVNPAQHLDKYYKQHEIIWYSGKFGGQKTLRGDIWECKRQKNTVHPTMKPIELIAMALQDQPDKKIVYDGFGGSGSTLIACEQMNKICYTMELDPKYIDVIIERWEEFTGKKAQLISE